MRISSRRMSHFGSYIGCLASSDARNEAYMKEEAELTRTRAELAKVRIELLRAVERQQTTRIFAALCGKPALAGAENYLNRLREEARRAMSHGKRNTRHRSRRRRHAVLGATLRHRSSKLEFDMLYPDGRRERAADVATPFVDGSSRPARAPSCF